MSDPKEPTTLEDYAEDFNFEESDFDPIETEVEDEEVEEVEEEETEEGDYTEPSEEVEEEVQEKPSTQTPEQNAQYAEQRRQNLVEQRVQQELQKLKTQAPEFQMAQMLSEMYGMPVDQLYNQLQEVRLKKEAEQRGVPIEVMKQLNTYEQQQAQLQQQLNLMQFQNWQSRVDGEAQLLLNQYPMLNQDDMVEAKFFLLETLQNPEIPLQNAVFAIHGHKITESLKNLAKQEALAEISGRKKGGLPPQSMKTNDSNSTLTEEERYIARNMGMSESEYLRWKK
jgi:hypothetical protein